MQRTREQFIERSGLLWEQEGLPRIAGRTFALILLSSDELSLDEIASQLGVSKASISNDARMLERMGFLERTSRPGDRKDYYRVSPSAAEQTITERLKRMDQARDLFESGRELAGDDAVVRTRFENHLIAFDHVAKALRSALEEIEAKQVAADQSR